jgi:hypothetical protein
MIGQIMKRRIRIILAQSFAASAIIMASGDVHAHHARRSAWRQPWFGGWFFRRLKIGLKTYPRSLALADHEIVLTFDDGPAARPPKCSRHSSRNA